ncbi:major facilitator superfamily permease [Corynebacterium maris DSM 45190]|uniref:Major facilitator superfamily permease n=2 Tax=Corynebacterium TaxID=1716 RepID=S5SXC9_9CORY|nr:major facilitator superfamily permease [Corynebacterium maris DSM 45190]
MLAVGLAVFNALYATQAMLPMLTADLEVSPTAAALTVSAATGALAVCIVPASILSERYGRGRVLIISALAATAVGLLLPLAPDAGTLIVMRAVQGALVAGTPAVAMTWLSEEVDQRDLGRAMGLYISGNTLGGLSGRLIPAGLLEFTSWRWALFITAVVALVFAVITAVALPKQRRFTPRSITLRHEVAAMARHVRTPSLVALFAVAFVGMGVFVSVYNFFGFRLIDDFGLSPALVGAVFVMYLAGTWSSARAGALSDRIGRGTVMLGGAVGMWLGLWAVAAGWLWLALTGLFVFTASFFAMHSTASSWIGVIATENRAEASSMYLFCYYTGSSLLGGASGWAFSALPWTGFIAVLTAVLFVAVAVAAVMAARERQR